MERLDGRSPAIDRALRRSRWRRLSAVPAGQQARRARRRSRQDARRAPRPRALQGHDQGADAVRRPAAGHRSQSRGGRLDRGAAQELRLRDRAHRVTCPTRRRRQPQPARAGGPPDSRDCERRDPHRRGRLALPRHHAADRREQRSRRRNPTSRCARSTRSRASRARASRCTARRSARRVPTRCTSSAPTWTASAGARPPTTTDPGRRS